MKRRLLTAFLTAAISGGVGLSICLWQHLPMTVIITSVMAGLGFLFGLVFKIQAV
jgi:hypothetical protein